MAPSVEAAGLADVPEITDIFLRCFNDDFFQYLFPRNGVGREYHLEAWKGFILSKELGGQEGRVLVTRNAEGNVAAASLIWIIRPGDGGVWSWRRRWPPAKQGQDDEQLNQFFTGMAEQHETIMGKQAHIYFELVFVDPSHHRQGHAAALVRHAGELADEMGYACYLDADQDVMPMYVKQGYAARSDVDPTSFMLAMVRPPTAGPTA